MSSLLARWFLLVVVLLLAGWQLMRWSKRSAAAPVDPRNFRRFNGPSSFQPPHQRHTAQDFSCCRVVDVKRCPVVSVAPNSAQIGLLPKQILVPQE